MPFYGNYYLHDPGTMIKDGNAYYIFGDGQGISGITSTDLATGRQPVRFFLTDRPHGPRTTSPASPVIFGRLTLPISTVATIFTMPAHNGARSIRPSAS